MTQSTHCLRSTAAVLIVILTAAVFFNSSAAELPKAQLLKTGLYLLPGGGCNSLLRLTANGLIVVDSKLPGKYQSLVATSKKISDQPIRVLINTDYHPEHTGNNSDFLANGTQILAQANLSRRVPTNAAPTKTYDRQINFHLGGIDVEVLHFNNAHTDGDSVVYFPNLKVIALGDLWMPNPVPDLAAGGTLAGWAAALDQILKLDFDLAVPSQGPPITKADLEAFEEKLRP